MMIQMITSNLLTAMMPIVQGAMRALSLLTGNVGKYSSLQLDSSGYPVIAYYDDTNDNLKLVHCNDANCAGGDESIVIVDSTGNVGSHASLQLDSSGYPVIAYYDDTNGDLKLAHCNDVNCAGGDESISTIDSGNGNSVGSRTSLQLDPSGYEVISYIENTKKDAKVARNANYCATGQCRDGGGWHHKCNKRCDGSNACNNWDDSSCIDHCTNTIQDCDETGVDCGGSCPPCNQPPTITSVSDAPDPQAGGLAVSFTSVASDPDPGDTIKLYVCKDSACTNCGPSDQTNCWAYSATGSVTNPSSSYTCPSCSVATNNYYAKVCDNIGACSSITPVQTFSCKKENGCAETIASNCFSGFAIDGYCCDTACTGTCQRCDATPGTCTLRAADDNTECGTCHRCDGVNPNCQAVTADNGKNCSQDCTKCDSGSCVTRAADDNTEVTTTCHYCDGVNSTSQPYTGDNGINCNETCTKCSAGSCTIRPLDENTECAPCNHCDGVNASCQAQTGQTGWQCVADCYDCIAGACTAMTEDNDGACNEQCTSCVAGVCTARAADDNTECGTCRRCDGTPLAICDFVSNGQEGKNCTTACKECDGSGNCVDIDNQEDTVGTNTCSG